VKGMVKGASFTAVMDTCHSATMFDLPWRILVNPDNSLKHVIAHYRAPDEIEGSVLCISACQDDQEAYQIQTGPETTHGALTSCMSWLLENRDTSGGPYPSIQEVILVVGGMLEVKQTVTATERYADIPSMKRGLITDEVKVAGSSVRVAFSPKSYLSPGRTLSIGMGIAATPASGCRQITAAKARSRTYVAGDKYAIA